MFTPARRQQLTEQLLSRAADDERVVAAARTGSAAAGTSDQWSDVDLFLGTAPAHPAAPYGPVGEVLADWTAWLYADAGAVHHFDMPAGPVTYRAFVLNDGLEVDLGIAPADHFGPIGPGAFDVVFGKTVSRSTRPVDTDHLVGLGWHHALHARAALARNAPWQAQHWISALREHTLVLVCLRHDLPAHHGKGADQLPTAERAALTAALPTSLDAAELARALAAAVDAFTTEAHHADPAVAIRLAPILSDLAGPDLTGRVTTPK